MHLLLLSTLVTLVAAQDTCIVTTDNGHYDLTPLTASDDYTVEADGRTYYLNVCRAVSGELWNPKGVDNPQTVGARYRGEHGDYSMGNYNTTLRFEHNNPLLIYENGSPCAADMEVRTSTAIRFLCDNTVFGPGKPQLVASLPPGGGTPCAFFFEWRTHVACPGSPRTSIGSAVGLLVGMVLLFLFLIIGLLLAYRWYAMQKRGLDLLPRPSIGNFVEGFRDLRDFLRPTRDRWRDAPRYGGGRDYYETLAAEEENRPLTEDGSSRLSFEEGGEQNRPVNGPAEANAW